MIARPICLLVCLLLAAVPALGQPVAVPNPSFEEGAGGAPAACADGSPADDTAGPAGWTLSGGQGRWLDSGAADGRRAVAVSGKGDGSNFWRTGPLPLAPWTVYRLRFRARSLGANGGTPISGPVFCNRDLGGLPAEWQTYDSIFITPRDLKPDDAWLRFGQWEVKGEVAFDDVELLPAQPVYTHRGDLVLGEGESVRGNAYVFQAPLRGESRNHSRPLESHACPFNTDRWTFGPGSEVVYRHRIGARRQIAAQVDVSVTWYAAGELAVEVSPDGKAWQPLGTIDKLNSGTFPIPAAMLPAADVWVRLRAQPASRDRQAAGIPVRPPSLQVGDYAYKATLAGEPATLTGATRFVAVLATDPRVEVTVFDLGDGVPGGSNGIWADVKNKTDEPIAYRPIYAGRADAGTAEWDDSPLAVRTDGPLGPRPVKTVLKPGDNLIQFSYAIRGTGAIVLRFALDAQIKYRAEVSLHVADLDRDDYGERLPGATAEVGLWWCSSGWKISQVRPPPDAKGGAVVIRAAKNEAEAAQVVVRPAAAALRGLTAKAEGLKGPGGAVIPASAIEILRVRYVPVTRPTDSTGTAAPWPDPLPPFTKPIDVEAGRNQPLWVRVTVPKDAKAGTYTGRVRLAAEGYEAEAPLRVEVFDFALPDRMTCQSAFGFSPGNVWRYQKVTDPQDRRAVLEKYLASFARHHISPYDPAPLDPLKVTWPKSSRDPKGAEGRGPGAEGTSGAALSRDPKGSASPGGDDLARALAPTFDWTAWDAAMARAVDQYHFNTFMLHVPGMGGGTFHQRFEPQLQGYKEDTPEYQALLGNYLRAVQEHLRGKGWLKYAYIYWFDEPDKKDYAFVMNGFRKLKAAAPDLRRMLTEQVEPDLAGGPNLWCPVTPEYNHARAEERRKAGEEFWWYVCCGPKAPYATLFIDHPATELRVWLWQTWQRRIDGILVWSANYWTSDTAYPSPAPPQNPYEDPMGWVSGYGTAKGARQPWGNGDGRFVYPPEAAADAAPPGPVLEGPVDSIRWEMLRDGIEDYEYLATLRRLLAERGGKLPADERARCAALLDVPEEITRDMTTFTKDPAPIERRREAVARAIEALGKP